MAQKLTHAARNRKVRQQALREQLSAQGHVQHVVDILEELNDAAIVMDNTVIQRKKIVIDTKLRLISKYLPDVKQIEMVDESEAQKEADKLSDEELEKIANSHAD